MTGRRASPDDQRDVRSACLKLAKERASKVMKPAPHIETGGSVGAYREIKVENFVPATTSGRNRSSLPAQFQVRGSP